MSAWPIAIPAIVPVFNHGSRVGAVVEALSELGARVIAIDDGSTDNSGRNAAQAGAEVIRLERNQGKAAALLAGFAAAGDAQSVVTVDADGQHLAHDALTLALAAAARPDALHLGVRSMAGAPWSSRLGLSLSNTAVRLCSHTWVADSQTGLRSYPLPAVKRLGVRAERYAWEVEVLIRAARAGIAIAEHPVDCLYTRDRISHFGAVRDSLRLCSTIARLALRVSP